MSQVFFTDNQHLWETDGTAAGTHQVSDDVLTNTQDFAVVGGTLFFANGTITAGGPLTNPNGPGPDLWRSDGTAGGTYALKTGLIDQVTIEGGRGPVLAATYGISKLASFGGEIFFAADDPAQNLGDEL